MIDEARGARSRGRKPGQGGGEAPVRIVYGSDDTRRAFAAYGPSRGSRCLTRAGLRMARALEGSWQAAYEAADGLSFEGTLGLHGSVVAGTLVAARSGGRLSLCLRLTPEPPPFLIGVAILASGCTAPSGPAGLRMVCIPIPPGAAPMQAPHSGIPPLSLADDLASIGYPPATTARLATSILGCLSGPVEASVIAIGRRDEGRLADALRMALPRRAR